MMCRHPDGGEYIDHGWFLVSDGIIDSPVFNGPAGMLRLWIYMLCRAHRNPHRPYRTFDMTVHRGEFPTSLRKLHGALGQGNGLSMSTIRRWLDQFEKDGMITIRKIGQGGMIIKLVNFSRYQNLRNYRGCSTARNTSIDACTHDTGPNSSLQHDGVKHPRNTCETPAGHMDIDDLEDTYELDDQEGGPAEAEVAGDVGADPITRLAKHMVSTYIQVYQDVHEVTPSLPDHPMRRVKGAAKWLLGTYGDLSHEEILEKFAYQLRLHDPLPKLQFLSVDISPVMVRKARRTTKNNSKYPMVSRDINRNEENE